MAKNDPLFSRVLTAVLGIWVLFIAMKFSSTLWQQNFVQGHSRVRHVPEWRSLIAGKEPSFGIYNAPVTIIEFVDYQCPFCKAMEPLLEQLVSNHPGRVAIYRYNFPLEGIHRNARVAAMAASCAEMQGVGEPYQAELFSKQASFSTLDWVDLARQTGIRDIDKFSTCMRDKAPSGLIDRDQKTGRKLKISGTPTLIINGVLVEGIISSEKLNKLYAAASRSQHRSFLSSLHDLISLSTAAKSLVLEASRAGIETPTTPLIPKSRINHV